MTTTEVSEYEIEIKTQFRVQNAEENEFWQDSPEFRYRPEFQKFFLSISFRVPAHILDTCFQNLLYLNVKIVRKNFI